MSKALFAILVLATASSPARAEWSVPFSSYFYWQGPLAYRALRARLSAPSTPSLLTTDALLAEVDARLRMENDPIARRLRAVAQSGARELRGLPRWVTASEAALWAEIERVYDLPAGDLEALTDSERERWLATQILALETGVGLLAERLQILQADLRAARNRIRMALALKAAMLEPDRLDGGAPARVACAPETWSALVADARNRVDALLPVLDYLSLDTLTLEHLRADLEQARAACAQAGAPEAPVGEVFENLERANVFLGKLFDTKTLALEHAEISGKKTLAAASDPEIAAALAERYGGEAPTGEALALEALRVGLGRQREAQTGAGRPQVDWDEFTEAVAHGLNALTPAEFNRALIALGERYMHQPENRARLTALFTRIHSTLEDAGTQDLRPTPTSSLAMKTASDFVQAGLESAFYAAAIQAAAAFASLKHHHTLGTALRMLRREIRNPTVLTGLAGLAGGTAYAGHEYLRDYRVPVLDVFSAARKGALEVLVRHLESLELNNTPQQRLQLPDFWGRQWDVGETLQTLAQEWPDAQKRIQYEFQPQIAASRHRILENFCSLP